MSDFGKRVRDWTEQIERGLNDLHVNASEKVRDSVVIGSALTGAPGQPVDTGTLKNDWLAGFRFVAPLHAKLSTNMAYAPAIEDDNPSAYDSRGRDRDKETTRPEGGRSEVGGPHSVKLTVAGWKNIIRAAKQEVLG
jgi:hypothetical protein